MIINRFGLRSDVMSFNLSGMGCSRGILSISLAKGLLKVHKNSTVLVLSMESEPDDEGNTGVFLIKINPASGWRIPENKPRKPGSFSTSIFGAHLIWLIINLEENLVSCKKKRENLKLKERDVEASKMKLYRFGNTSSSSIWYALVYLEAKGRVKRADTIWQLGLGSGFKCNSAVWKCISNLKQENSNGW
ncbi:hypothetical protein Patl1_22364 [Pistacia atlantica]|uniref:Uncharacterized protein n=1 Tax=Pistacia atlantica TaxID=434234 RepID=A0ACC1A008_9ROSI|nr:hypothetical protein Patl1_22364 [Pistacia atlantica]